MKNFENTTIYAPCTLKLKDDSGKEYLLTIQQDDLAEDPRNWDNTSTIWTWIKSYKIGDDHDLSDSMWDALADLCVKNNILTWEEMEEKDLSENRLGLALQESENVAFRWISAYEHSGITISTAVGTYPYNDRWDSGIIGFAFVMKEQYEKQCGKRDDWKKEAIKIIDSEVKTVDQWLCGECYRYTLEEKVHYRNEKRCPHCNELISVDEYDDWDEVDSCCGFYGNDIKESGILDYFGDEYEFVEEVTE